MGELRHAAVDAIHAHGHASELGLQGAASPASPCNAWQLNVEIRPIMSWLGGLPSLAGKLVRFRCASRMTREGMSASKVQHPSATHLPNLMASQQQMLAGTLVSHQEEGNIQCS